MGSHRARHRPDRNQSEELASDLLARLAAEAPARPGRARHVSRPVLDPFGTAPFPARPPRQTAQDSLPTGTGGTRCSGTNRRPTPLFAPTPVGDHPARAAGRTAATQLADRRKRSDRLPADPGAPFPIDLAPVDAPAGLAADDPARTGRGRLASLRTGPLYAAVSATVITATAAVAASAGPATVGPTATPDLASPSLAAAAGADLALPGATSTPAVPPAVSGPATVLANAPTPPVSGSAIAAQATADAKTHATGQAQARVDARQPAPAPAHVPAHVPKTAPKPAAKAPAAAKPAAAPAGSGVGARALALAKGKVGDPYVWGAAGPGAFDCSGLIVWAYKQLGISLPHSSATLSTMGTPVSQGALQPGDLVFFYSPVSHVGIYVGNGMILNATQSGEPVKFSKLGNLPFHNARRITG